MANWLKKLFGISNKAVPENQPMSNNQAAAEAIPETSSENVEEKMKAEHVEGEAKTPVEDIFPEENSDEELSTKTE